MKTTSTERMRKTRRRQKLGTRRLYVEVSSLELEFLRKCGYEATWDTAGEVISTYLADQMLEAA